jgi:hypothetical protein
VRPPPVHDEKSTPLRDRIEQWSKIAVASVAIVYVLGFVVHTLYLGSYGLAAMNLLRAQYILAGVWLLSPLAVIAGGIAWVFYVRVQDADMGAPKTSVPSAIVIYLVGVLAATAPFLRFVDTPQLDPGDVLGLFLILVLMLASAGVIVYAATSGRRHSLAKILGAAVFSIFTFLAYTSRFATLLYPAISSVVGGGKPATVRFIVDAKDALPIDPKQTYPLLVTTDHSFIVLDRGRATELPRDKIKAVLYEPPPR